MSTDVDYDLLADYIGGALDGTPQRERVAGLIATSPQWGRAADELTAALHGVQHDLNVLRTQPEPMPEDVAARFEGVFEGLFDGPKRDPLEARVVSGRSRHRAPGKTATANSRKRLRRWAAPVAIVAAALGFLAIGQLPTLVGPAMNEQTTLSDTQMREGAPPVAAQAAVPTAVTWFAYDRDNLQLTMRAGGEPLGSPGAEVKAPDTARQDATEGSPLQRLMNPLALQQCLSAVAAVLPGRAEFAEYAYFEGSPALVISITSPNGQWRFVAGANCGQLGPDERFRTPLK